MLADVMRYRYDVQKSKDFLSNLLNEQKNVEPTNFKY